MAGIRDRIIEISRITDRYNWHSHTQYCDGRASMDDMARAAAEAGFRHWGFSPHSPICVCSPCNMSADAVAGYIADVRRLSREYVGRMEVYAGMEIDYLNPSQGPASEYFRALPLDYRIGSVHFVPLPDGSGYMDVDGRPESFVEKMHAFFHDDIRYVVDAFYDQSMAMVEAGGFDIIGHFDKIGYNASVFSPGIEEESWYRERVDSLVDAIIGAGVIVEINTKAYAGCGRMFPAPCYWPRLVEAGVPLVVNSDAHYPDKVDAGRREALTRIASVEMEVQPQ